MAPPDDTDDKKALDAITELDPATRAELERWFGLPSFAELEEKELPTEDPSLIEARERREKAIAAVDPALLDEHQRRTTVPDDLLRFRTEIELRIDPEMPMIDFTRIDAATIAEPREIDVPEPLRDDLRDCTPQALLRDLHRPETDFQKVFEVIDFAAEGRIDASTEARTAMTTRWQANEELLLRPGTEARQILRDIRAEQREPWAPKLKAESLPNRRWAPEEDQ
jgi:hypothetical protein